MTESLYVFRCLVDYMFGGADRVEKQNELLADAGIDTDFSNDVSNKIRNKCRELGKNGWAISPFWKPNNEETWYDTWYELLQNGKKEKVILCIIITSY